MTHRSEYLAGKTESSVAVNVEINTTVGGKVICRRLREWMPFCIENRTARCGASN
jgi:hypothetical protein